jgi:hypothetical protein
MVVVFLVVDKFVMILKRCVVLADSLLRRTAVILTLESSNSGTAGNSSACSLWKLALSETDLGHLLSKQPYPDFYLDGIQCYPERYI